MPRVGGEYSDAIGARYTATTEWCGLSKIARRQLMIIFEKYFGVSLPILRLEWSLAIFVPKFAHRNRVCS